MKALATALVALSTMVLAGCSERAQLESQRDDVIEAQRDLQDARQEAARDVQDARREAQDDVDQARGELQEQRQELREEAADDAPTNPTLP